MLVADPNGCDPFHIKTIPHPLHIVRYYDQLFTIIESNVKNCTKFCTL